MAVDATRAVVEQLYAAYAQGDGDKVAALIDDDIDWMIFGPVAIFPFQGTRRGKAQVLETLGVITKEYALQRYEPSIIIVEGDRAAVMSDVAFTQRATGRLLSIRLANFLRVRDGKITEFREFMDTFDAVEQAIGTWINVAKPPSV